MLFYTLYLLRFREWGPANLTNRKVINGRKKYDFMNILRGREFIEKGNSANWLHLGGDLYPILTKGCGLGFKDDKLWGSD